MEMPARWKPQNGFHSALEISHSTRDSHISTAAPCVSQQDHEEEHDERHAASHDGWTTDARLEHAKARASREGTQGGKVLRKRGPILLRTDNVCAVDGKVTPLTTAVGSLVLGAQAVVVHRSEERRVGKECRL